MTGLTVWLASYPKSGNTWLRAVYAALRGRTEPNINALGSHGPARALFDGALGVRSSDLSPDEVDALRPRADEAMIASLNGDSWRKIHDALFAGPRDELIVSVSATRAALYLVRDPRDVAVSLAHHADLTLHEAVDYLSSSTSLETSGRSLQAQLRQRLGSWSEHVRSWTDNPPFPVHVLRYEDCMTQPVPTFRAAFAAGGLDATEDEVAAAVARSSLVRLQAQEIATGFREAHSRHSPFFRQGLVGGWKDELPADLARRVVDMHGEVMTRYGY